MEGLSHPTTILEASPLTRYGQPQVPSPGEPSAPHLKVQALQPRVC